MTEGTERRLHVGLVYWDPFTPGGPQSQVAGRIDRLGRPDGPVRYTLFTRRPPPSPHPWPHVRTVVFGGWDRFSIAVSEYTASRRLVRLLDRIHREDPFDLVDLHNGGAGPALARWSRRSGVPYLFTVHSLLIYVYSHRLFRWDQALWYRWANRRAAKGAQRVIVVSQSLQEVLVRLGIPAERIEVQHNSTGFEGSPDGSLRPASSPLRVLCIGRPSHEKGLDLLLDAAERCAREPGTAITFELVGPVGPDDPLRRRAESAKLALDFLGPRAHHEILDLLSTHDVLVIPSRYDTCPVVAVEAFNAGTLVIAFSVGGVPELVEHERTGLLIPPEDVGALARTLLAVARDPHRYLPLRAAARQAGKRFHWSQTAPRLLETYRRCAAQASRDPGQ